MRWIKANQSSSPKKEKKGKRNAADDQDDSSTRTVIVFNPLLWKEEIVSLLEDWKINKQITQLIWSQFCI